MQSKSLQKSSATVLHAPSGVGVVEFVEWTEVTTGRLTWLHATVSYALCYPNGNFHPANLTYDEAVSMLEQYDLAYVEEENARRTQEQGVALGDMQDFGTDESVAQDEFLDEDGWPRDPLVEKIPDHPVPPPTVRSPWNRRKI